MIINTEYLTDTQIMRKVLAATKKYMKANGMNQTQLQYIRGSYYFTNLPFHLDAADVIHSATGLWFIPIQRDVAKHTK